MYQPFNRSTFISCENAASEVPKLQSDLNFWYSAIISCGGPPKSPFQRTFVTHDLRKGLRLWQLPIRIPPHLCASDAHDLCRGSRFEGCGLAAPAATREKDRKVDRVLRVFNRSWSPTSQLMFKMTNALWELIAHRSNLPSREHLCRWCRWYRSCR